MHMMDWYWMDGGLMLTLGDLGGAEAGLDQDIPALGTEGAGDGVGESVDTGKERGTSLNTELELL